MEFRYKNMRQEILAVLSKEGKGKKQEIKFCDLGRKGQFSY